MTRRRFLKRLGLGVGATAIAGCSGSRRQELTLVGPSDDGNWRLAFEDRFGGPELDTDNWGVGWGWGRRTTTSNTRVRGANVTVTGGQLQLHGSYEGESVYSGAINTKNSVTFGPGSYLEARVRFADRQGFQNAVWSKPNSEAWPPEIDVVEQWHDEGTQAPTRRSHHHLHYPASGQPGDGSTHTDLGYNMRPGDDITENFHVYGVEWRRDRIVHYVDGDPVRTWEDETMLSAMARGAPFYLMVSLNINNVGTAERTEPWTETLDVDWIRLWNRAGADE